MMDVDKATRRGYFKGFLAEETGSEDSDTYSIILAEFVFLEGPNEGEKFWQPRECVCEVTS